MGIIDGVHGHRHCFLFPMRGGFEDGGPCEVVVQSACRVRPQLKSCHRGCWGEACGARGIRKNDRVAVVRAWQAAPHCWLDPCPLFPGGPQRGGGPLESSGSVHAHPLVNDLGRRWVNAYIVVVPFVSLCEVAVHIFELVRFLWVECGPFNQMPVLDLGAAVFNRVRGGLRCGAAVFGQHREGDGRVLGVPHSPVESPLRCGAGDPRHCGRVLLQVPFEVRVQPPALFRGSVGRWYVVVARQ